MKKLIAKLGIAFSLLVFATSTVFAANGYTFFGEADYITPGYNSLRAVRMVSDNDPGYGGVDFDSAAGTTFAELQTLSTDYNVTEGSCGGGTPRFQINVIDEFGDEGNIFAYLGTTPNYTCTPDTWLSSGDLLETGMFVDTTQLTGGTFYDPYDTALLKYGSYEVTGIQLVTDGGWMFGNQTVLADNVVIDDSTYTFEPTREEAKESCKKGGWQTYTGENGTPGPFRNQGQCISYFNHNL